VKDKRTGKDGPEFLVGWLDFPLDKDASDTWEPITNLTGSENMICEFQKKITRSKRQRGHWTVVLQEVDDKRKTVHEKNVSTVLDKTADDIQEERDDSGGDDTEEGVRTRMRTRPHPRSHPFFRIVR